MINDNKSCNVKWKLHGNISRNSYGNAVVGRYGGCFEEDVWVYVQENKRKSSHGFWMYWRSMHNSQCEQKAMHSTEEASKFGWWKCQKPQLNISQKELTSLLQTTSRFNIKSMIKIHSKKGRSRRHKYPVRSLDLHTQPSYYEPLFRHGKLSSPTTPSTILLEFVVRYKLKDNSPLMILT